MLSLPKWPALICECSPLVRRTIYNISVCSGEDDDDDYISSDEIVSRTQFPESWLWEDITLPSCQENQNWYMQSFFFLALHSGGYW